MYDSEEAKIRVLVRILFVMNFSFRMNPTSYHNHYYYYILF